MDKGCGLHLSYSILLPGMPLFEGEWLFKKIMQLTSRLLLQLHKLSCCYCCRRGRKQQLLLKEEGCIFFIFYFYFYFILFLFFVAAATAVPSLALFSLLSPHPSNAVAHRVLQQLPTCSRGECCALHGRIQ